MNFVIKDILSFLPCTHTIAPSDFVLLSSNLTFAPSQNSSNVVIQINNDGYSEITEEFAVDLISHNGNVIIQDGKRTLQVVITDQTGKCTRRVLSSVCVCVCLGRVHVLPLSLPKQPPSHLYGSNPDSIHI